MEAEFFHWLNLDALMIFLSILSRISVLILPISDLVGLISRQVCFLARFALWSFSVLISSSVYSVIDTKFRCDFFVFCMDVLYGIGMRFL